MLFPLPLALCLFWSNHAFGQDADSSSLRTRRAGYTTGTSGGLVVGAGRGYPDDNLLLREEDIQTRTGVGMGPGGNLWLGVSVNDWLGITAGASRSQWRNNGLRATSSSFQMRFDVYPLMNWGGLWRDLGLLGSIGVGRFRVDKQGAGLVRSNETSVVGLGAFFVPVRFAGVTMGPQVEYNYQFAIGVGVHTTVVGWRTAFHTGPSS